jgi:hypothetical protein
VGLAWRSSADGALCFTTVSSSVPWSASQAVSKFGLFAPRFPAQILHRDFGFATVGPSGGWFLTWVEPAPNGSLVSKLARVRDGTSEVWTPRALLADVTAQTLLYPSLIDGVASVGYALITPAIDDQTTLEPKSDWCH